MPKRVCVVLTARASYARIRSALFEIQRHRSLELQIAVGASAILDRYGDIRDTLRSDGFPISAEFYAVVEGENPATMAKSVGLGLIELSTALQNLKPDVVVTIADRHETLATAIAASHMNIPLVHVQGGERTGSIDGKVRNAVTQLADVHCVATKGAGWRVKIALGFDEGDGCYMDGWDTAPVHVVGCPSIDLAAEASAWGRPAADILAGYTGVGAEIDPDRPYLVVLQHPVTTEYNEARLQITETLYGVHLSGYQALWFWPNVDAGSDGTSRGIRAYRELHPEAPFRYYRNMRPVDFLGLLVYADAIVGNSSTGIRECSYLAVPAVNIGTRQEGRERAENVIDVPHDMERIREAIQSIRTPKKSLLYGDGKAGQRIAEVIAGM